MVLTGADWMTDPPVVLPEWATVPVKILRNCAVELAGATYVLHSKDDKKSREDPCYWCAARRNMRLCDVLCPYCRAGFFFVKKLGGGNVDER
jgi:hypothetical protein